jgi:ring-1,2-phenylacetyl-CoA epoxidase subunit PaaD
MVMKEIYDILETVKDPEIPVISIVDLGIIREVRKSNNHIEIDITPTYSGCPALDVIPVLIEQALLQNGYDDVRVKNILAPAWTTDWISEKGLQNLKEYGIAPPVEKTSDKSFISDAPKVVPCPQCDSKNTRLVSQFGSTPCKSAYQCNDCKEPFDYFKCH